MSTNDQSTNAPTSADWKRHVRSVIGKDTNAELKLRSVLTAAAALTKLGDTKTPSMHDSSMSQRIRHNGSDNTMATKERDGGMDLFFDCRSPLKFPEILMEILSDKSNSDSITWLDHGRSFIICNRKKFSAEVLPRYWCKTPKYTSFTRKLGRWDFVRIANGSEEGAFYHKLFRRDEPDLCKQMNCGTGEMKSSFASLGKTTAPEPVLQQRLGRSILKALPFANNHTVNQQQMQSLSSMVLTRPGTSSRLASLQCGFPINPLQAPVPIKPGFSPEAAKNVIDAAVRTLARSNVLDARSPLQMNLLPPNPVLNVGLSESCVPLAKSSFALRKTLRKSLTPDRKVHFSVSERKGLEMKFPQPNHMTSSRAHAA